MLSKEELRRQFLQTRQAMSTQDVTRKSKLICNRIQEMKCFIEAKKVGFYHSVNNEVDLNEIMNFSREKEKVITLPKVRDEMSFHIADDLEMGKFGILEPGDDSDLVDELDLILVPGVAYDRKGTRIGYGKGYYDNYLKCKTGVKVGVAFDSQINEEIEKKDHDVKMDYIVTESGIIDCRVLDGKKLSQKILEGLKKTIIEKNVRPKLAIVRVGINQQSKIYTEIKCKKSVAIGVAARIYHFQTISEAELITKVKELCEENDGIIVQLPLPQEIDAQKVINCIEPSKDVDGLTTINQGKNLVGEVSLLPATPKGILRLLDEYKITVLGKRVTIINRSNIVGKPLAVMLTQRGATVTICHSKTENLEEHTKIADIVVSAVGKKDFIREDMVKEGVVIIDVGINKEDGIVMGDVDYENVKKKASWITPVPGGVGPMTVAMLLENVVAAKLYKKTGEE
jgi:methylenetetrahydrofolate dehydrogenase (NADP+) / methenyltetrahydrofolate cyclohydrolase